MYILPMLACSFLLFCQGNNMFALVMVTPFCQSTHTNSSQP
jgi:hypothetical protein